MKQFEYVEDAKLRKPTTPSTWKCFPEYTLITRVRMACGGGLGGASWYEWTPLLTEKDVVNALDKNEPLKIRIGY